MSNNIKSFNKDKLPDFVKASHPQFELFLDAYYEWLELQNTAESSTVLTLFNQLQNPGGLVANASSHLDIDTTLNGFVEYFQNEVLPISVETAAATNRFTIKKIRDLYLSKGTPKSFDLLFQLLFNKDIELIYPYQDVIKSSDGSYLSFPIVYFRVREFQELLTDFNFNLSYVGDSELDDSIVTVLSANVVDSFDGNAIIKAQLATNTPLEQNKLYHLFNSTDVTEYIVFDILPTVESISLGNGGSFFKENDQIKFTSKYFGSTHYANIRVAERSPIDFLAVRSRGANYSVGDTFIFTSPNNSAYDGKGGNFRVTAVDAAGRITEIDGQPLRTGSLANGHLSSQFNEVVVPLLKGGEWKVLPNIEYRPVDEDEFGAPYNRGEYGYGAQFTPIASKLGSAKEVEFKELPYFLDSDDISVEVPINLVLQNQSGIKENQIISFQTFVPSNESFTDDSETITVQYKAFRKVEDNWSSYHLNYFTMLDYYDSDLFQWGVARRITDSDKGLELATTEWKNTTVLEYELFDSEDDVWNGQDWDSIDSDGAVDVDGGATFAATGDTLDLGSWNNRPGSYAKIVYKNNKHINELEKYHFDQLRFITDYEDSEFAFSYRRYKANPNLGIKQNVGAWKQTEYYAKVVSVDENIVRIIPTEGRTFPTKQQLEHLRKDKYQTVRITSVDDDFIGDSDVNIELTNVLVFFTTFDIDFKLNSVVDQTPTFINENGFLSSPSGGVLHDSFLFSRYSYVVKSDLSMADWRSNVKKLLHPAGSILFGIQYIEQQPINLSTPTSTSTEYRSFGGAQFDFSSAQDHSVSDSPFNNITADSTLFKTNSYEIGDYGINSDNYSNIVKYKDKVQRGNAFWDYEPIGLVRYEDINYVGFGTYENFVAGKNKVTTQDSDANGNIKSQVNYWQIGDSTKQDLYRNNSRFESSFTAPVVSSTFFQDAVSDIYHAWDSEVPTHVFMRFGDSDAAMSAIDYTKLSSVGDIRNYPLNPIPRQREYSADRNRDFADAMREDGSLTETIGGVTYTDFDAYEQKWNTFNADRTYGTEGGWEIAGWPSFIQNTSTDISRKRRNGNYGTATFKYSKIKTPFSPEVWNDKDDEDWWVWNNNYTTEINKTTLLEYDKARKDEGKAFDRDPEKWMLHRRER